MSTSSSTPESKFSALFPICAKAPALTIEGSVYRFRRLGLKDGFQLLALLNDIASWGYTQGEQRFREIFNPDENLDERLKKKAQTFQTIITALLGIEVTEKRIYAWISSTLGRETDDGAGNATFIPISSDDLQDPGQFPLDACVDVIANLAKHPDLESFFSRLKTLAPENNPIVKLVQAQVGNSETEASAPNTQEN